jgi:glyoxylase-like metal-dependent hydrolase (beta-lactamase superfamily II)
MRLYVLSLGTTDVDKGVLLTPGVDVGTRVVTPVPAYLIETDAGERVLIDTGLHPGHIEDPAMTWGDVPEMDAILRPAMGPEHTVEHQLGLIGLMPDDVTHVVSSHLHFDHCGQHLRFAQQPILVSGRHLEAARESSAFCRSSTTSSRTASATCSAASRWSRRPATRRTIARSSSTCR